MRTVQPIGLLLALILSSTTWAAAARPDFSGTWKLNLDRSEFGGQTQPKSIVQTITHRDPSLKADWREVSPLDQDVKYVFSYSTDGKETTNSMMGTPVRATAKWDGDVLAVHSSATFGGNSVDLNDRWRLAEGGTTLIVKRHAEGNSGKVEQTIIFDKQ